MGLISLLRRNIGTIIACIGTLLLCIITFGDLGNIMTDQYWHNVFNNLTSIGFMTIALTLIQVSIKQGVAEQALQKGLNTVETTKKWEEHRALIQSCQEKILSMPYFLQAYNTRQTNIRKKDFLVNNNYTSEQSLYNSKNKHLIKKYNNIKTYITVARIKWATTEISYNNKGQIQTLTEYRSMRLFKGVFFAFLFMIGLTLLSTGLFISGPEEISLVQKFIKLSIYILTISASSIYTIIKEYEKGAFGVPNELEELNQIWKEFYNWKIPDKVYKEINKEVIDTLNETREPDELGTIVQKEFEKE